MHATMCGRGVVWRHACVCVHFHIWVYMCKWNLDTSSVCVLVCTCRMCRHVYEHPHICHMGVKVHLTACIYLTMTCEAWNNLAPGYPSGLMWSPSLPPPPIPRWILTGLLSHLRGCRPPSSSGRSHMLFLEGCPHTILPIPGVLNLQASPFRDTPWPA